MRLARWIIAQASLLAVVFGVSLSGYGMAQAHTAIMPDASAMDHSAHAHMDHAGHDMTSADHGAAHDGHANCPMIACCHTGGTDAPAIPALTDAIACLHVISAKPHLDKAEPDSAKKPPRHA